MRLYNFFIDNQHKIGLEKDNKIADISYLIGSNLLLLIKDFQDYVKKIALGELNFNINLKDINVLAPFHQPQKIICIGQNYLDHCREQNVQPPLKPIIFAKFPSAITGPYEDIIYPDETQKLDFEGELAVIIGKEGKKINRNDAYDYVFGYSVVNDISARDLQDSEWQWVRAKSLDSFAPFGPCVVTKDEILNPHDLSIKTWLNGNLMQDSSTREMIFNIPFLIEFISRNITLLPGDIILTGTPNGVGHFRKPPIYMQPGDEIKIEIDKIGTINNKIVK
jgi:2-keto-4-pentenoate hydratase/2-oxohepta-3-ene-1,7-dioic acid hydratase in catechol pathway